MLPQSCEPQSCSEVQLQHQLTHGMKYILPPIHSITLHMYYSPQLSDGNYSLCIFHVFDVSSFSFSLSLSFSHVSAMKHSSTVTTKLTAVVNRVFLIVYVSADQTIEKPCFTSDKKEVDGKMASSQN